MLKVVLLGVGLFAGIYFFIIAPGFVGNSGSDGALLKQYVSPESLRALIENPSPNIWIIDVRSESAWRKSHIPTSKSFFSGTIADKLNQLPQEKYLILYCETGGRVQSVIKNVLIPNGYTRYMNWGGFSRWPYETVSEK